MSLVKKVLLPLAAAGVITVGALGLISCNHSNNPIPETEEPGEVKPDYSAEKEVIRKAADRLVATQNNDGGWDWSLDADPTNASANNTIGVTAMGTLEGYVITGKVEHKNAAINAYNLIQSWSSDSSWRIRGPDISFLVKLSEIQGNSAYADLARAEYLEALSKNGGTSGLVSLIKSKRTSLPALIPWDINLYVKGALALNKKYPGEGFDADARAMTEETYNSIYGASPDVDLSNTTQDYFLSIHTGAAESFALTGLHSDKKESLLADLLSRRESQGLFLDNYGDKDFQTTAYAIMSLLSGNNRSGSIKSAEYLRDSQESNGGWGVGINGETEVDSEVAHALGRYISE